MDFLRQMGEQLNTAESLFAFFIFALAVLLAYLLLQFFTKRKITAVESTLQEEQVKVSTLTADNEKLQNEMKVNLAEVNESKLREEETKSKNSALIQEKDQLESQIIMLSESEAVLKDQLDDVNSRYSIMETSHQNLNDNLKRISLDFETSVSQKDGLYSRIQELEAVNQELLDARTRENAIFTTQVNSLKESLSNLQIEYSTAQNELNNEKEAFNEFKSQVLVMKAETGNLKEENEELKVKLEHQDASKSKMQLTLKSLLVKQNQNFFKMEAMEDELEVLRKRNKDTTENKEGDTGLNAEVDALKETLEDATNKVATLEAEKINYSQEIEILREELEEAKSAKAKVKSDDKVNPSFSSSSFSLENRDVVLGEELMTLKSQLKTAHEAKVAKQQEADRLRASVITLQADLAKAEEDKAIEQEHFLKELAGLRASHEALLELETGKLDALQAKVAELENTSKSDIAVEDTFTESMTDATNKIATLEAEIDTLESKITLLEASANDAEHDVIAMEASKNNVLDIEYEKLASARDENMKLQTQVNSLLSKVRELQTVSYENDDSEEKNQMIDSLAAQATQLEAMANDAVNDAIDVEAKFGQILEQESEKLATAKDEVMALEAKIEELEAKLTLLEASANDAEHDVIAMEKSQSHLLEMEHTKLASARDENMKLQTQVSSLLSKIRELQLTDNENGNEQFVEELEEQATLLEAMVDGATNETIEIETKYASILEQENKKLTIAQDKVISLEFMIETLEAKVTKLEAVSNEAEQDTIELEGKYQQMLELENEKLSAAKENALNLEIQVDLLQAKLAKMEASANDAENDLMAYQAKMEQMLELENSKLADAQEANLALQSQINVFRGTKDDSINVDIDHKKATNIINNSSITAVEADGRTDSEEQDLDAFQAELQLKKILSVKYAGISKNNDNDLKVIKGVGPRIEEKLYSIGIFTFKQIAELDEEGIKLLTTALDIFPGRIERDKWVEQAKELMVSNEHLTTVEARAAVEALIGNRIPMATASNKNDLKIIKGVGTFIEKKLNGLGIYTYDQVASFDKDIVEKVTIAIEFFPGRIERDKWVKQAKELM